MKASTKTTGRGAVAGDGRSRVIAKQREIKGALKLSAPIERTPAAKVAQLSRLMRTQAGNGVATQRTRIITALRGIGPLTTHEIRQYLDVVQPTTRVHELRHLGYRIETRWVQQETAGGRLHRFAQYVLARE